jgi:hypothetical protein
VAGCDQFRLAQETVDRQAVEVQDQIDIAEISARAADKSAKAASAAERVRINRQPYELTRTVARRNKAASSISTDCSKSYWQIRDLLLRCSLAIEDKPDMSRTSDFVSEW